MQKMTYVALTPEYAKLQNFSFLQLMETRSYLLQNSYRPLFRQGLLVITYPFSLLYTYKYIRILVTGNFYKIPDTSNKCFMSGRKERKLEK